jgi:hypothetical protein
MFLKPTEPVVFHLLNTPLSAMGLQQVGYLYSERFPSFP